jgi:SAM-dependent methyltransferase
MWRRRLALLSALAGLVLIVGCGQTNTAAEKQPDPPKSKDVTLKVHLENADWVVYVDGKEYAGEGKNRELTVPAPKAGTDLLVVKGLLEPNNYTKIYRTRKVRVKDGKAVADLTKEDSKLRDHIEVRYVPTPDEVVDVMCKMGKVGPNDVVYDLGCGDGRIVITAVKKYKAKRGVGVDLDPNLVKLSKKNGEEAGVSKKVQFRVGDVLKIEDLSDATVVMLYMGDDINLRLRPILKKTLKPGARVVSHRFTMGDWKPEKVQVVTDKEGNPLKDGYGTEYKVLLWTIGGKAPVKKEAPPKEGAESKEEVQAQDSVAAEDTVPAVDQGGVRPNPNGAAKKE